MVKVSGRRAGGQVRPSRGLVPRPARTRLFFPGTAVAPHWRRGEPADGGGAAAGDPGAHRVEAGPVDDELRAAAAGDDKDRLWSAAPLCQARQCPGWTRSRRRTGSSRGHWPPPNGPGAGDAYEAARHRFELGETVRHRREELGIIQAQLAERAGLQQPAVARFETGVTMPTIPMLERPATRAALRLKRLSARSSAPAMCWRAVASRRSASSVPAVTWVSSGLGPAGQCR